MKQHHQILLTLALVAAPMACLQASSERESAVVLARSGHMTEAIQRLQTMLASGMADPLVTADLLTLLQQAGRASDAVSLYERARPANLPSYALLAITRAYRDSQRFDRAERLAREGLRRFPDEPIWPILLALVLTDAGRPDESLAVLASPAAERASASERALASGYAERRAQRPLDALRHYATVARLDPANVEARDAVQAILRDLRAPWGANRFASAPPPLPLASEMAAAEVRWDDVDRPYDPRQRFVATDRSLATLDALVVRAAADKDTTSLVSLRMDRMVALRDRVRMADVVAEADVLRRDGVTLPPYAREALADALLYLRQPRAALAEYEAVLATDPHNEEALGGRFYATVELEDFAAAYALADQRLAAEPVWRRYEGDPTPYPRDQYLDALLQAAAVRLYGDQPAKAWSALRRNAMLLLRISQCD